MFVSYVKPFVLLTVLAIQANCLIKRYSVDTQDIDLAVGYQGSLTSSYTCAGQTQDLGTYNESYIIVGAPLKTYDNSYGGYGKTWDTNPVYIGFFHSSTEGGFTTYDYIYGLGFSSVGYLDKDGYFDPSKPGERILNLNSPSVSIAKALVGSDSGYVIAGDQNSVDSSAPQPNGVGIYLPGGTGLPNMCGPRDIIFNWTQALPFNWGVGFSNNTAWFSVVSQIGNGTSVTIALNATRVLDDSQVRESNTVLDTSKPQKPVFKNPAASSSTSSAAAATSSSAALTKAPSTSVNEDRLLFAGKIVCGFAVQYVISVL